MPDGQPGVNRFPEGSAEHPLRIRSNGVRSAVVTIPAGTTLRFRYLAEGGIWFDDETAAERDAHGAVITIQG